MRVFYIKNHFLNISGFFNYLIISIFFLIILSTLGCTTNKDTPSLFSSLSSYYGITSKELSFSKSAVKKMKNKPILKVSLNDGFFGIMILEKKSTNIQTWHSSDLVSFTTKNARINQFYHPNSDISLIKVISKNEKINLMNIALNQQIYRQLEIDFLSLKRFSVKAKVLIKAVKYEERVLWGEKVNLLRIEEHVVIPSINFSFINLYWKDSETNFVWESIQKWGEESPKLHYQVIKPWKENVYP